MPSEFDPCLSSWTRITVLLPFNNRPERNACASCYAELRGLCNVLTYNSSRTTFVRYYKNPYQHINPAQWIFDDICIVSGDINLPIDHPDLLAFLRLFELNALSYYESQKVPQLEIWITASVIHKLSSVSARQDAISDFRRNT